MEIEFKLSCTPDAAQALSRHLTRLTGAAPRKLLLQNTYYDTPTMQLLAMQSGVRKRHRVNITNPSDRKSGRELMQIKVNSITSNDLQRGEVKFAIEYPTDLENPKAVQHRAKHLLQSGCRRVRRSAGSQG